MGFAILEAKFQRRARGSQVFLDYPRYLRIPRGSRRHGRFPRSPLVPSLSERFLRDARVNGIRMRGKRRRWCTAPLVANYLIGTRVNPRKSSIVLFFFFLRAQHCEFVIFAAWIRASSSVANKCDVAEIPRCI